MTPDFSPIMGHTPVDGIPGRRRAGAPTASRPARCPARRWRSCIADRRAPGDHLGLRPGALRRRRASSARRARPPSATESNERPAMMLVPCPGAVPATPRSSSTSARPSASGPATTPGAVAGLPVCGPTRAAGPRRPGITGLGCRRFIRVERTPTQRVRDASEAGAAAATHGCRRRRPPAAAARPVAASLTMPCAGAAARRGDRPRARAHLQLERPAVPGLRGDTIVSALAAAGERVSPGA